MPDCMPDFQILVAGKPLDIDLRHLNQLTVDESLEMMAKCEFSIQHSHSFVLKPDWVMPGMRLEVSMGYVGYLVKVFAGDIATLEPEFPDGGVPSIRITAYDLSYNLKRHKRKEVFASELTRSGPAASTPEENPDFATESAGMQGYHSTSINLLNIVRRIAGDPKCNYGLELRVSPSAVLSNYTLNLGQSFDCENKSDWEALNDIAALGDYNIFVKFGIGNDDPSRFYLYIVDDNYLMQQQSFRLKMIYNPGPDDLRAAGEVPLLKFNPKFQTAGKRGLIELAGWSNSQLAEVYGKATLSDIGEEGLMKVWTGIEKLLSRRLSSENMPENTYQAKIQAAAELRRQLKNLVTGDAIIAGNPRVQIGQQHEIVLRALGDFGPQYSGHYMLNRVAHSISPDEGYRTTFDVRRGGLVCYSPLNVGG